MCACQNRKNDKELMAEKFQKIIHPLVQRVISVKRNFKLEISGSIPPKQPLLFVANHYGIDDIPTVGEVIGIHTYPLVSDEDKGTLNGLALDINGVVWTNRLNKEARRRSKEELVRHLRLGHSVLMYPEATWNLSPNLPMLPMNYGCITIALETNTPIVPIYLHFTKDMCRVKINEPFYPNTDKIAAIQEVRDIMASSAWDFWDRNLCSHEQIWIRPFGKITFGTDIRNTTAQKKTRKVFVDMKQVLFSTPRGR